MKKPEAYTVSIGFPLSAIHGPWKSRLALLSG
ncbi:hypothetical protein J2794_005749 [Paraburkholderia terricola]|nr:hypothetical protein [Paraburkholderia terricola]